jgi:hypothetical protein
MADNPNPKPEDCKPLQPDDERPDDDLMVNITAEGFNRLLDARDAERAKTQGSDEIATGAKKRSPLVDDLVRQGRIKG